MKAVTKKLSGLSVEPAHKIKLARRTSTLEFKTDVVRYEKGENLNWADAGKACDLLRKLVKECEPLYGKVLVASEATLYAAQEVWRSFAKFAAVNE